MRLPREKERRDPAGSVNDRGGSAQSPAGKRIIPPSDLIHFTNGPNISKLSLQVIGSFICKINTVILKEFMI